VTALWAGRSGDRILATERTVDVGCSFNGVKAAEACHWAATLTSGEVKNELNCTFTPLHCFISYTGNNFEILRKTQNNSIFILIGTYISLNDSWIFLDSQLSKMQECAEGCLKLLYVGAGSRPPCLGSVFGQHCVSWSFSCLFCGYTLHYIVEYTHTICTVAGEIRRNCLLQYSIEYFE
jgi:hypothetical protein